MARKKQKENAASMATRQREISVSEFFSKNRHLLGFDNPRKALLTAIKEAVDNALDACEEAEILPDLTVSIKDVGRDHYVITVEDNGPGILKKQIPNIFGKLLYGSKFHRLKMSRGQQGIGISAAGMYGLITTGKAVEITSRTSKRKAAHFFSLRIDTRKNKPEIIEDKEVEWDRDHGTRVSIELVGKFSRGKQSVDEYLRQTAITNPHVHLTYHAPDGESIDYPRSVEELPPETAEIKPHPRGVELGVLQRMLKESSATKLAQFLQHDFSRISARVAEEICDAAKLSSKMYVSRMDRNDVQELMDGIENTKIMNPPTNCVAPIGEEQLMRGLESVVPAEFYASATRPPAVYRGNPFIIEAGLAWGHKSADTDEDDDADEEGIDPENQEKDRRESPARVLRFANRVPLLYQQGACCSWQSVASVNWRGYGLSQPKGSVPTGPLTLVVHMASVWVPFTSESKEAIAAYPEIEEEMRRALQECGRKLKRYLSHRRRAIDAERKQSYIKAYIPHIGIGLRALLDLDEAEENRMVDTLTGLLERARE